MNKGESVGQTAVTGSGHSASPSEPVQPSPEVSPPGAPAPSLPPRPERHPSELSERESSQRGADQGQEWRALRSVASGVREHAGFLAASATGPRSESSEPPYPEAPLASRKAPGPDPKPLPRYIDPEVLRAFHDAQPDCLTCGYYRVSAHHLVSRAQRGGDVAENLIPLCGACHGALHDGNTYHAYGVSHTPDSVRFRIGRFLTSEAGEDHLAYVKAKLGTGAAAFLERYGVEL